MEKELINRLHNNKWYDLGLADYPNRVFIKELKIVTGNRTRACLKAIVTPGREVRFLPCYKKKYSEDDAFAITMLVTEFSRIVSEYGFTLG